ncbi:MAG: THUMP-like domain-containing protein [Chitinivibrionales bacterium]
MELNDIRRLSMPDAQAFIRQHRDDDPHQLVLSWSGRTVLPLAAVAEQVRCRRKADRKLPSLADTGFLFEETALSQSTGEAAAHFKRTLMSGNHLIDCTGGLGVDTLFLRKNFHEVLYCERAAFLRELFIHNRQLLGAENVTVSDTDCVASLRVHTDAFFDWAYIDPSRRDGTRRFVGLTSCEPDIGELEDLLVSKARRVCVKASPALEISEAQKALQTLYAAAAVSVDGECKELLLFLRKEGRQTTVDRRGYVLGSKGEVCYSLKSHADDEPRKTDSVGRYFYEPDPALIKADLLTGVAREFNCSFIHPHSAYMTSDTYHVNFPGRGFQVVRLLEWNRKTFKRYLREQSLVKAHVARRWFPLRVEQIRSRFKLLEGGNDYFFFTADRENKHIVVHCRKR